MTQHRTDTLASFDKQFGPFDVKELEVVGKRYDDLNAMAGKLIGGQAPHNAAKALASGLLGQAIRSSMAK